MTVGEALPPPAEKRFTIECVTADVATFVRRASRDDGPARWLDWIGVGEATGHAAPDSLSVPRSVAQPCAVLRTGPDWPAARGGIGESFALLCCVTPAGTVRTWEPRVVAEPSSR